MIKIHQAIDTAFRYLPRQMDSAKARVMLYAIGWQESRFEFRDQVDRKGTFVKGPALGFWQFEQNGGCRGILHHNASKYWIHELCAARGVEPKARPLWLALENDDVLAAGAARLLLFTDPKKLPDLGDEAGAWDLYAVRTWRPGKPHPETWSEAYNFALNMVNERAD